MLIIGELEKYRPFTETELRLKVIYHAVAWLFAAASAALLVVVIWLYWKGGQERIGHYALRLAISIAASVIFMRLRGGSTLRFVRERRDRNRRRYAVEYSRPARFPETRRSMPFHWRENPGLCDRGEESVNILVPLDGSLGEARRFPGLAHRRSAQLLGQWRFAAEMIGESVPASKIRVIDPAGGNAVMPIEQALDFVNEAPFDEGGFTEADNSLTGIVRHLISTRRTSASALAEAERALLAVRKEKETAVSSAIDAMRRLYASRQLSGDSEGQSIASSLGNELRKILPREQYDRIPTPVEHRWVGHERFRV